MKKQVDLTPFICEAFASNRRVYKMIEQMYEGNRVVYYQEAKANRWYNHEILTSQSIEQEIVAKRALAILLEGDSKKILSVVRVGWRSLYNWAKKQTTIKISDALNLIMSKNSTALDKLTNDEVNAHGIVAMLLGILLEKEIDQKDGGCQVLLNSLDIRLQWAEGLNRFSYTTLTKEEKAEAKRLKNEVYKLANVNRFFVSYPDTVHEDMGSMLTGLCFLFDMEGLSTGIVENEVFSERDINEIVASYICSHAETSVSDASRFLAAGHIVKALLRAYKNLKKQHFKTSRETLFLDLDLAQHEADTAQKEVRQLNIAIKQYKKEIDDLRKKVKTEYGRAVSEYQIQLKDLQAENADLRDRLFETERVIKDLERALIRAEETDTFADEPIIEIPAIKGVIVGGHQRWHMRMKDVLPDSWQFIHPDDNIDMSVISNADIVLFFTDYLSHLVYDAVVAETRQCRIPTGYLRRTNEVESLKEIRQQINQKLMECS